jgi:hypothetical protein
MKLPRLRRKPAPETAEPASAHPAAPVLQMVIYSNTDLPEDEFRAQTEKLRRVASYDNATRSWYGQIPFDRPEWAAEMLTAPLRCRPPPRHRHPGSDPAGERGQPIRAGVMPGRNECQRTCTPRAAGTACQPHPESGGGTVVRPLTAGQP